MIRKCEERDFEQIWEIINDAALIYRGIIPADRYSEPYMPREELRRQMEEAVLFWAYEEDGRLLAVMGMQQVKDVTLIRHAYVRGGQQKRGIGGALLAHLREMTSDPVLIGTWQAAFWAIRFYEQHGFVQVTPQEKDRLLRTYWNVPERQIETSVVLADWKRLPHRLVDGISGA
jgi:N-acetylglutamate synthase-like GNAT family acetyltransferase